MLAPQLVREHAREGVQRGLRDAVGGRAAAHRGKRPRLARNVYDAPTAAPAQERNESLRHAPSAERVRLECLAHRVEVRVLGSLPSVVEYGRVVHEHVESTETLL